MEMPFGMWTRMGSVKMGGAHWCHLANTIEPSTSGGSAAFLSDYDDHLLLFMFSGLALQATYHMFIPSERCIPKIRIQTRQVDELVGKRIIVAIDVWPRNNWCPQVLAAHFDISDQIYNNSVFRKKLLCVFFCNFYSGLPICTEISVFIAERMLIINT